MPFDNGRNGGTYGRRSAPRRRSTSGARGGPMVSTRDRAGLVAALNALSGARGSPGRRARGRASYGRPTKSYTKRGTHGFEGRLFGGPDEDFEDADYRNPPRIGYRF